MAAPPPHRAGARRPPGAGHARAALPRARRRTPHPAPRRALPDRPAHLPRAARPRPGAPCAAGAPRLRAQRPLGPHGAQAARGTVRRRPGAALHMAGPRLPPDVASLRGPGGPGRGGVLHSGAGRRRRGQDRATGSGGRGHPDRLRRRGNPPRAAPRTGALPRWGRARAPPGPAAHPGRRAGVPRAREPAAPASRPPTGLVSRFRRCGSGLLGWCGAPRRRRRSCAGRRACGRGGSPRRARRRIGP